MRSFKNNILIILAIVFVGIQFVPTMHNQSQVVPKTDFKLIYEVPDNIANLLKESCYDCHSSNTRYPWYSNIQPVAWFLESHIKKGKKELNFSDFGNYSTRRQKSKLRAIINQISDNEMPLASYTFLHHGARLSTLEKKALMNYAEHIKDSLN